jgi:hypothetical protein
MKSNSITRKFVLAAVVAASVSLTGCVLAPLAVVGATATGTGTADDAKLTQLTGRNFGVDPSQVKISNVKKDNGLLNSTIYYQAEIKTGNQSRTLNCMITSNLMVDSSPLCAKPGESLTGGGSGDNCNALSKAAGRC